MRRIIFVSQVSGRKNDPLKGAGGRRLAALAGLDHDKFLARFDRVVLDADLTAARTQADERRLGWAGRRAMLLGRGVAVAFRLVEDDFEWFKPLEIPPGIEVAIIPGTAGIGNWWNDQANTAAAREYMLRLGLNGLERRRGRPGLRGGQEPEFTEDEVRTALIAARGINSWAAEILAEETGVSCTGQTIANYIRRFPALAEVRPAQQNRMLDVAEHNVARSIEDGDLDTTRWLLRSQMANGRGYALQVNGKVHVSGQVDHRHVHATLDQLTAKLTDQEIDVLEGLYQRLADEPSDVAPDTALPDVVDHAPRNGIERS